MTISSVPAPVITTDVAAAAAALAGGRLVAFATETVYGLGAAAENPAAVAAVYQAKGRPLHHPVIVHLADFSAAAEWAAHIPAAARRLAAAFMPGPLTMLLPRLPHIRHLPGGDLIALRVPAHPQAQALLRTLGGGVIAPSANRFGALSPTCAAHVADEFSPLADLLILDGGECTLGIESTIVGFSPDSSAAAAAASAESVYIVRPGSISAAMLAAAGVRLVPPPTGAAAVAAPGTLPRHYAPRTPFCLAAPDKLAEVLAAQTAAGAAVGVLSRRRPAAAAVWECAAAEPARYAQALYRLLRRLDAATLTLIIAELPPDSGEWAAVHDRLQRAAGDYESMLK